MKPIFTFFTLFLFSYSLFSQSQTQWGEETKSDGFYTKKCVLKNGSGGAYFLKGNLFLSEFSFLYSDGKDVKVVKKFNYKNQKDFRLRGAEVLDDRLIICYSKADRENTKVFLQVLNSDLEEEELIEAINIDIKSTFFNNLSIDLISNPSKKNIAIVWNKDILKAKKINNGFVLYNESLEKINEFSKDLDYDPDLFSVTNYFLLNNGNVLSAITEYDSSFKKENAKNLLMPVTLSSNERKIENLYLYLFKEEDKQLIKLELPEKQIFDFNLIDDKNNSICVLGSYYSSNINLGKLMGREQKNDVEGLFYFKIDLDDFVVTSQKKKEFEVEMIVKNLTPQERLSVLKKYNKNNHIPNMKAFVLNDVYTLNDGSILGTLEQRINVNNEPYGNQNSSINSHHYNSTNVTNQNTVAAGYTTTSSTFRSLNSSQQPTFLFEDILAFKINEEGNFEWITRIQKKQISQYESGIYSSYLSFVENDKFRIVFNDTDKNYKDDDSFDNDKRISTLQWGKWVVAEVELDINEGSMSRKVLIDSESMPDKSFSIKESYYDDENKFLHFLILKSKIGSQSIRLGKMKL